MTKSEKKEFLKKGYDTLDKAKTFLKAVEDWAKECAKYPSLQSSMETDIDLKKLNEEMGDVAEKLGMN